MNDQRQQITQKILLQSDEERTAMNVGARDQDFTYNSVPSKKTKLNELNGEMRLKIKIGE